MLNVISYYRNQNHSEVPLYIHYTSYNKKGAITVIGEALESSFSWWECKIVQPLQKIWHFFKKLNIINLLQYIEIAFLSIYPREVKAHECIKTFRQMFTEAFYVKQPKMRKIQVSMNRRGISKLYIPIRQYSAIKKNELLIKRHGQISK